MDRDRFGRFFRERRLAAGMGLREFCKKYGYDAGNISKLERGRLTAPRDREKLGEYAKALGLKEGREEWQTLFRLAEIDAERIPQEILSNEALVGKLPLLFRTLATQDLTEEKLDKLIDMIRRA